MKKKRKQRALFGICRIYTETGYEGSSWAFQESHFIKPHDGLRVLKEGDFLTIFDKKNKKRIVWNGIIMLRPMPPPYAFGKIQWGTNPNEWRRWFAKKFPAQLIPHKP